MLSKHKTKILALVVFSLLMTMLSACSGKDEEEAPLPEIPEAVTESKTYYAADNVFSLNSDKDYSFNPFSTTSTSNILCTQLMYDNIFNVDEAFEVTPVMITDYSSEDGKSWRFTVDNDIKFWDGSTLTASDVSYSIQRAMRSPQFKSRLSIIMGVSAIDESLFIINLYNPDMLFPALLNIPVIKNGSVGDNIPMGTGPYILNEELTELTAFPSHRLYNSLPLEKIHIKEFKDIESAITAFENSEIDLVTNDPTSFFSLGYSSANEIRYFPTTNMHYIGFNSSSRFFSNPLCRKAMTYVVDREHIVNDILKGSGTVTTLPMSPNCQYYNSKYSDTISYSAKKSESAFDLANVKDFDDDGLREILITGINVEVDPPLDFIVCSDSSMKVAAARSIADNLTSLGINVALRELSWEDYRNALAGGKFDMYYAETKLSADFSLRSLLTEGGSLNYGKFTDATVTDYINGYLSANDENRQTAADLMFQCITDSAPIVPICFEKQQVITHRGVISGLKPTQYNIFNGIENWEVSLD